MGVVMPPFFIYWDKIMSVSNFNPMASQINVGVYYIASAGILLIMSIVAFAFLTYGFKLILSTLGFEIQDVPIAKKPKKIKTEKRIVKINRSLNSHVATDKSISKSFDVKIRNDKKAKFAQKESELPSYFDNGTFQQSYTPSNDDMAFLAAWRSDDAVH
jgi:hypothetical protein